MDGDAEHVVGVLREEALRVRRRIVHDHERRRRVHDAGAKGRRCQGQSAARRVSKPRKPWTHSSSSASSGGVASSWSARSSRSRRLRLHGAKLLLSERRLLNEEAAAVVVVVILVVGVVALVGGAGGGRGAAGGARGAFSLNDVRSRAAPPFDIRVVVVVLARLLSAAAVSPVPPLSASPGARRRLGLRRRRWHSGR